jgi:3-deoxy-D-manno-octulosonic-acid transferase
VNRVGYTLLLYLLLPRALWHLVWRARRQPAYLQGIPERFGYYKFSTSRQIIWIHAVSVGETRAAEPLVRALQREYPRHRILLSHMTPTGREIGLTLFGDTVERCYLPYDFPGAAARFLNRFQPSMGILMETELWPNLIHAARARAIPVFLINARLSAKSYAGYQRFSRLMRDTLQELDVIGAQSAHDAERLAALGATNVVVTGNMKFDFRPDSRQLKLGKAWREDFGARRRVLLAASTRDGEEALLLGAYNELRLDDVLLVIVPRHPQRFEDVAGLIRRSGLRGQRRSNGTVINPDTQVLLGDSMGELYAYYAACDVAFVGGSLLPFGGQNMIEACAVGRPVLFGPHTYNFLDAAENAIAAGAARRVTSVGELMSTARTLLLDSGVASRMGAAGLAFVSMHQGATARVLELLKSSAPISARARR